MSTKERSLLLRSLRTLRRLRKTAALRLALATAILLSLGVGTTQLFGPPAFPGETDWRTRLDPISDAPIARGAKVALVTPALPGLPRRAWLYEASARRPDVLWGLASSWPSGVPMKLALGMDITHVPAGWHTLWRRSDLVLAERRP